MTVDAVWVGAGEVPVRAEVPGSGYAARRGWGRGGGNSIRGMGIEDLLGGRDLGDVKKAVGFVMENSDDFEKVLKLVRGLPDNALGLIGQPELLKTIGSGLADAGEQAVKAAANALVGDDGEGGARRAFSGAPTR